MTRFGEAFGRSGDRIPPRNERDWWGDDLAAAGITLAWGAVAHRFVPERARPVAGATAALGLALLAHRRGANARDLGCAPSDLPRGLRLGALAAGSTETVIAALGALDRSGSRFQDSRIADASRAEVAWHLLVRIPLATALVEELAFRGVILGLGLRRGDARRALLVSSVAFGLWHIGTALHPARTAAAGEVVGHHAGTTAAAVVGDVVATTVGGIAFGWLRVRSGSIAAPALAHAALNAGAYVTTRVRSSAAR